MSAHDHVHGHGAPESVRGHDADQSIRGHNAHESVRGGYVRACDYVHDVYENGRANDHVHDEHGRKPIHL